MVRRSTEISTSGGSSDTDMKAFAVMPWIWSPAAVVITVTPVANMPSVWRRAVAGSSPSISSSSARGSPTAVSPIPSGPEPTQAAASARLRSNSGGFASASGTVRLSTRTSAPSRIRICALPCSGG